MLISLAPSKFIWLRPMRVTRPGNCSTYEYWESQFSWPVGHFLLATWLPASFACKCRLALLATNKFTRRPPPTIHLLSVPRKTGSTCSLCAAAFQLVLVHFALLHAFVVVYSCTWLWLLTTVTGPHKASPKAATVATAVDTSWGQYARHANCDSEQGR